MAESKYQGVILAAGHGSRMGPFGERVPKPIAPICNKPLLAYQLEHMRRLGITDVIIVIGHLGHVITQVLGDGSAYGVKLRYVEQEKRLGLAHAVGQLERHIDRPFMLFLGDIFFQVPGLEQMIACFEEDPANAAVLAVMDNAEPEAIKKNFSIYQHPDGAVRRVVEKPRHIENSMKGCGLYLFDSRIFEAIRRTPRTAMRDEYELTDSIQILIDYEYKVRVSPVVEWDMNLTFIGDLIECCVHEMDQRGVECVVGEGSQVAEGVQLRQTVVGDGAVIRNSTRLDRCVVMPGVVVEGGQEYQDTVFTESGKLYAKHGG